jgi:hypothetical protein
MKFLEELAPSVKTEAPEQLQLLHNAAIALNSPDHFNSAGHSARRDCKYNWSPTNPEIALPQQAPTGVKGANCSIGDWYESQAKAIHREQVDEAVTARQLATLATALSGSPTSTMSGGAQ